ncbi:DgyrCDS5639 [Dimorphilus gyrociliatus]|uniref:D-serine dehydratase n=1 Tax=Dimorphilus gyrociliatus TaxID=2664684 RepID=A0A7I8VKM9_9ANNE|nr:DgyrCDS5639 [Dimorphilus gyrociliatus]
MENLTSPAKVQDLQTPCFLIDREKVANNAKKMIDICEKFKVVLRPHMKTAKTIEAGNLMTNNTKQRITVSTIAEAEFFAANGFDDILYGYIFTYDKLARISELRKKLKSFHLMIDGEEGLQLLLDNKVEGKNWTVYLAIECGGGREGIEYDNEEKILKIAKLITNCEHIELEGLYVHDGNSYEVTGEHKLKELGNSCVEKLLKVSKHLEENDIKVKIVGQGSTPTCSIPGKKMANLNEFHPGNYIFYDVQQSVIGSCNVNEIAGRVMTRIIGHYPSRNEMLIDAGFLALSHDGKGKLPNGSYCLIYDEPRLKVTKMTQEIGYVTATRGDIDFKKYPIGSTLFLLPYHSCATAAMFSIYYLHDGEDVVDTWKPCKGW